MNMLTDARVLVSVVLLVSGLAKLLSLNGFVATVERFSISPAHASIIAVAIPVLEIFAGGGIWVPAWFPLPEGVAVGLGCLFVAVNIWAVRHAIDASCGCFGQLMEEQFGPWALGRAAVLGGLAVFRLGVFDRGVTDTVCRGRCFRGVG